MSPSTRRMSGLLEQIAQGMNPQINPFLNRQRVELFRRELEGITNVVDRLRLQARYATELLNAGQSREAFDLFRELEEKYPEFALPLGARFVADVRFYQVVAALRLAEQENCLTNHNPDSCLFPIAKAGVHRAQTGSRLAIEILEKQLQRTARDRKNLWLLNLAYMTVGEYPDKVPPAWLIPPKVFASEYELPRFPDVAPNLGLDVNDLAGGTVVEDFDGDGYLDILISDWSPRGPMHFFHNNADGTFSDRTSEAGIAGEMGGLNLIQADYNNDGLPDVLVLRGAWMGRDGHHPDSLLRNDGNGHFTDVTMEAGLLGFHPNQTAVWFDFNGDGWLDLYFGYESTADNVHPCELFRNNHDGTFTECAAAAGLATVGFVKGVVSGDFNNDGRPDLYLSCRGQLNKLFRNDGPRSPGGDFRSDWKFTDVSLQAGVTEPLMSFPTWFFDYDNDGWEDIFVCGYSMKDVGDMQADYLGLPHSSEKMRLFHNNGDGTFADVTKAAHLDRLVLGMGANFGDFDNDGWLDMYVTTGDPGLGTLIPDRAFRNAEGKFFQDVTTSTGLGHLQKGHGVSFGDLDNDGDQDIYHSVGGAYDADVYPNALFENPGSSNHWVTLKLEGVQSNRSAIGARIKVVVQTSAGERKICRTVGTGGSFGANPLRQEIGLGQATKIVRVEIFWPVTGKTQVITDLVMNRFYQVREGEASASVVALKTFQFSKVPPAGKPHGHPMALPGMPAKSGG